MPYQENEKAAAVNRMSAHHDTRDIPCLQRRADRGGIDGIEGAGAKPIEKTFVTHFDGRDARREAVEDAVRLTGDPHPTRGSFHFAALSAELDQGVPGRIGYRRPERRIVRVGDTLPAEQ